MNRNEIVQRLWDLEAKTCITSYDYVLMHEAASVWIRDKSHTTKIRIGVKKREILEQLLKLPHAVQPCGEEWSLLGTDIVVRMIPEDLRTEFISGRQLCYGMWKKWMFMRRNAWQNILNVTQNYLGTETRT